MSALLLSNGYAAHDPGGKVRLRMLPDMTGGAEISPCGRYRPVLYRQWGVDNDCAPYSLFVGMNPSTADAHDDDPTIRREIGFSKRLGVGCYVKVNVADYRATDPRALLVPGVEPRSPDNLAQIMAKAHGATWVILAFGALKGRMREMAEETVSLLKQHRIPLHCLGVTADGSPRHPLYLRGDANLIEWKGWH